MKAEKSSKKIWEKIAWALVALAASLVIWMYLTGTQEEQIEVEFKNVELVFEGGDIIQETRGLIITEPEVHNVNVVVTGTRASIGTLKSSDLRAVIDVSRITTTGNNTDLYDIVFPDGVDVKDVDIVSRDPAQVQFTVTRMASKLVPVRCSFIGSVAEGYIAEDVEYEPRSIMVTGPETVLGGIDSLYCELDGQDIMKTRTVDLPYTVMDADGQEIADSGSLEFDSPTVSATLPISKKKEVPLDVNRIWGSGANEQNTIVTIEPATITIAGDAEMIDATNKIVIGAIDMTDFNLTYETTMAIMLDNEFQNITGITEAVVTVETTGLKTAKLQVTNFSWTGLPEKFSSVDVVNKYLEVTIRAPEDIIGEITSDNLHAVADLSGVTSTGDQYVTVRIRVDGFTDAGAVGDYKIIVNVR